MVTVVLMLALGCTSKEAPPTVSPGSPVLVASRVVLPGETLSEANVEVARVSLDPAADSTFMELSTLAGRTARERLLPGEPIRSERLAVERSEASPPGPIYILRGDGDAAGEAGSGASPQATNVPVSSLIVPRGLTPKTLSVAEWSAPFVRANGFVDLYATRDVNGTLSTSRAARQMMVLAAEGREITVAYMPSQHEALESEAVWTAAVLQPVDVTLIETHGPPMVPAFTRVGSAHVWVARSDFYPGVTLTPDDFVERPLIEGHEVDPTLLRPQDVAGKVLGERVLSGEPLRQERMSRGGVFPEARIPRGLAGVSVPASLVQTEARQASAWVSFEGKEQMLVEGVVVHHGATHSLVAVPDAAMEGLVHALQAPELQVVFR